MMKSSVSRRALLQAFSALPVVGALPAFAQTEPSQGGTINLVLANEPPVLLAVTSLTSLQTSAKTNEGLIWYNNDMEPQPQLATAWEISDDQLTYTFTLREGVTWHDGEPFTSQDVLTSLEILKAAHPRGRQTFANIETIEAPDDFTIVLTLSQPIPYLINAFAAAESPIVPHHLYADTDPATNPANAAPVGTGPFVFSEWVRGSHVIYERNPNYWDAPRPYVDRLIVQFMPDASARSVAFESGQVNLGNRTPVGLGDLQRLRELPSLAFETRGYEYSRNVTSIFFNLENSTFATPEVRQALSHLVDREMLVNVVYYGEAVPNPTAIGPGLPQYRLDEPSPYQPDVDRANELLDAAGFEAGSDGMRFTTTIDIMPAQYEPRRLGDFLRAVFSQVGIDLQVRIEDIGSYIRRVFVDREFDMCCGEYSNLYDPIVGVRRLYWSENIVAGLPFSNSAHYSNERVDELLEATAIETDEAARTEMFHEFQRIVMQDAPDITLISPIWTTISAANLRDHSVTADGIEGNFAHAYFAD